MSTNYRTSDLDPGPSVTILGTVGFLAIAWLAYFVYTTFLSGAFSPNNRNLDGRYQDLMHKNNALVLSLSDTNDVFGVSPTKAQEEARNAYQKLQEEANSTEGNLPVRVKQALEDGPLELVK